MRAIQFGQASINIDQSELTKLKSDGKRYLRYKNQFNELVVLTQNPKARKVLSGLTDDARIDIYGHRQYIADPFQIRAKVYSKDSETQEVVVREMAKRKLETLKHFWKRALNVLVEMDTTLQGPVANPPKQISKNYIIQKPTRANKKT